MEFPCEPHGPNGGILIRYLAQLGGATLACIQFQCSAGRTTTMASVFVDSKRVADFLSICCLIYAPEHLF